MTNNTPVQDSAFLLYISFIRCFCSTNANHLLHFGLAIKVVQTINLSQSIAEKSDFPYHKTVLS